MALARPSGGGGGKKRVQAGPPVGEFVGCTLVWEYLTELTYADGSPRETATINVFVDGGQLRACLNDRQEGRSLWMQADSLGDIIARLEAVLRNGKADWFVKGGKNRRGKGE